MSPLWKSLLPGIFLLGFNIGTGSVTAMAKASAAYGMSLLWTIFLSCMVTYFMIVMYGRYTLITGETALHAFRKHLHPAVGLFFILALTTNVCGSVMGVMGIIADICYEWSKTFVSGGISPVYFAFFFSSLVYFIFWKGETYFFQRFLAIIVAIMSFCFLLNVIMLMPSPVEIMKGMIPAIPNRLNQHPSLVIASMIGTTVFSGLFVIRTTLVKEAGWTIKDLHTQKRDAFVSAFMMFILSAAIMAAAAGTLYDRNIGLTHATQMVELLEPLAGRFAVFIFVCGIVAAGVSSQFPNILLLPWLLCDYTQSARDMTLARYRIMVFFISLLGFAVPLLGTSPVIVMIASQAFGALILPVTVICIFILGNKKEIMGPYVHSVYSNLILSLIFLFSLFSCGMGLVGLWNMIHA